MIRVLFVDDDPRVLAGLSRSLRVQRDGWAPQFASGGEQALEVLSGAAFDVIVSDMRMPGMDGAELLSRCAERWPHMVRIILSGQTEMETAMRSVLVAHQFITKPCESQALRTVIERALALHGLLHDEAIRTVVGGVRNLPSVPRVYADLSVALSNPETSARDIAAIVGTDSGMTANLLRIVNSAFFGLPRRVTGITSAVAYLGSRTIRELTLSVGIFESFSGQRFPAGFSIDAEQRHAFATGRIAEFLGRGLDEQGEAMSAGLVHDIGHLVLAAHYPERYEGTSLVDPRSRLESERIERQGHEVTHSEVGACLLGLWGLPYPLVEVAAHHHRPERVERTGFGLIDAVHVADVIAGEHPDLAELPMDAFRERMATLDLEEPGLDERVPGWREALDAAAQAPAMRS